MNPSLAGGPKYKFGMAGHRIYRTSVASVYPHYVSKVEKKGRTKEEVDEILCWLTPQAVGPPGSIALQALGQAPKLPGEPQVLQRDLVLTARMRLPFRGQAIAPPGVCEPAERGDGDGRAPVAIAEPALNVLLRPEEIHRASGEHDVVPPVRGGDQAVKEQALIGRALLAHVDRERLAAVWT